MSAVVAESADTMVSVPGSWQARLALRFRQKPQGCRLVNSEHYGPLYVQKPFYPEGPDLAHVYLLHPPGGLVSGDHLRIELVLEAGSRVLATTPGAGRLYRAREDQTLQRQSQVFDIGPDAVMEWLPQEMIVFPGAHARTDTVVDLQPGGRFLGWDICCMGLPASDLKFSHGHLHQRILIRYDGSPVLLENLHLGDSSIELATAPVALDSCPVSGIFTAGPVGVEFADPEAELMLAELRQTLSVLSGMARANVTLMNGFIIGRYLGNSAEEARDWFTALWAVMRVRLTGRALCRPRIWAT